MCVYSCVCMFIYVFGDDVCMCGCVNVCLRVYSCAGVIVCMYVHMYVCVKVMCVCAGV